MSDKIFQGMVELAVGDLAVAVARRRKCSPAQALKEVYHSDFYNRLLNPKSGLYFEGKAALIDLFMRQSQSRWFHQQSECVPPGPGGLRNALLAKRH